MKKLLALCMAVAMLACLAVVPASAAASNKLGVVEGKRIWLSTFDGTDDWQIAGDPAIPLAESMLDTADAKNGAALSATAEAYFWTEATNLNLDLSAYVAEGVVKLDLYIEDAASLLKSVGTRTAQWIGFSSAAAGNTDDTAAVWVLMENMNLKSGWNEISQPISEAYAQGGTDWSKITYVRVVIGAAAGKTLNVKLDNLRIELPGADPIVDEAPVVTEAPKTEAPKTEAPAAKKIVFTDKASADWAYDGGWWVTGLQITQAADGSLSLVGPSRCIWAFYKDAVAEYPYLIYRIKSGAENCETIYAMAQWDEAGIARQLPVDDQEHVINIEELLKDDPSAAGYAYIAVEVKEGQTVELEYAYLSNVNPSAGETPAPKTEAPKTEAPKTAQTGGISLLVMIGAGAVLAGAVSKKRHH